jgi:hypothetical protein
LVETIAMKIYHARDVHIHFPNIMHFTHILEELNVESVLEVILVDSYNDIPDDPVFVYVSNELNDAVLVCIKEMLIKNKNITGLVDYLAEPQPHNQDRIKTLFGCIHPRLTYLLGIATDEINIPIFYFYGLWFMHKGHVHTDMIPHTRFRSLNGKPADGRMALLYFLLQVLPDNNIAYSINPAEFPKSSDDSYCYLTGNFDLSDDEASDVIELGQRVKVIDDARNFFICNSYSDMLNCDFMVYTETCVSELIFITEKTYKLFASATPFILFASPGTLAHLKLLGFYTFGDVINEEYDDIREIGNRARAIVAEVKRINESPDYSDIVYRCKEIAKLNQQIMKDPDQIKRMTEVLNASVRKFNE